MANKEEKKNPGIIQTLFHDLEHANLFRVIRRDFQELKEFYIDTEKKNRLEKMSWGKRWFFFIWWIFKSLFLKLSPVRRILVIAGLLLLLTGQNAFFIRVGENGDIVQVSTNYTLLGSIIFIFVLLLEVKDKLLARDELEAGRKVQQALMPELSPPVSGWSLWLYTRPANEVGGDLVDFLRISTNRVGVVMADVAGKGLKAALLTSKLHATLRALASDFNSVTKLCSKVNEIFHRDSIASIFASLLYIEIRPETGKLRFVNAGHLPPVIIKQNKIQEMPKGEMALGLTHNTVYSEQILVLKKGECFVAYSDGLTEARNSFGEFFGLERLLSLFLELGTLSADKMGTSITAEIDRWVGEARANDDISLVILKRL